MTAAVSADQVLRWLVTFGLDDRAALLPRLDDPVAHQVLDAAVADRLVGVLAVACDTGALEVSAEAAAAVRERWRDAMAWCLKLEVRLLEVGRLLDAAGVPFLVLKGPAVAHLDEPDPSLRAFVDLDLLVPGDGIDAAVAALVDTGATRQAAPRRPGYDGRYAKSVTMRMVDGVEVDLHRMPVDGAFGFRVPLPDLWSWQDAFVLGGRRFACLDRPGRALHATYHAVLGSPVPRRMSVREVLAYLTDPALRPEDLVARADRCRGRAVLQVGLELVEQETGLRPTGYERWRSEAVHPRERRRVQRQRREGSGIGRAKLDALGALPWRERAGYLLALVAPSGEHLQSRGMRRTDLLRGAR